jgi:hypothetical protein
VEGLECAACVSRAACIGVACAAYVSQLPSMRCVCVACCLYRRRMLPAEKGYVTLWNGCIALRVSRVASDPRTASTSRCSRAVS